MTRISEAAAGKACSQCPWRGGYSKEVAGVDQMPRALCDAIEVTRAALYDRSTHALTASDCSLIYVALDREGAAVGYRARTRLAIQAARDALLHATFRLTAWRAAHRALRSDRARTVAPTYQLRFFFEWGVDSCLWPTTKEAWDVFDNPADLERLPLSSETTAQVRHLCTWYQGALNWEYPPDPGPWRQEECDRFNCASASLLEALRRELGERFEVIGEPYDLREDPRLDEYLGDPRTYHHKRGINH